MKQVSMKLFHDMYDYRSQFKFQWQINPAGNLIDSTFKNYKMLFTESIDIKKLLLKKQNYGYRIFIYIKVIKKSR